MAFTAVHYPTDKDQNQASYWPESEELGVASDNNFFEQFLAFDSSETSALGGGNDLLANPPSPSILLENLDADLSNSSSTDQDTQSGQSRSETSGSSISLDFSSIPSSSEQSKSVPLELAAPLISDPILSNGSISDSELLRLEGISRLSIESPKGNATAPQDSPLANQGSLSPRKHNRVLSSVCSALRRATHWSKPHKHQGPPMEVSTAIMGDSLKTDDSACYDLPVDFDLSGLGDVKLEETSISNNLPLSPPLTGRIPTDHNSDDIMNFVSGHFDDPFCDDVLAPSTSIDSAGKGHDIDLNTPMATPALDDDIFYQQTLDLIGAGPSYVSDNGGGMSSPGWWDTPQQANGHRQHGGRSHSHSHSSSSMHNNVSLNLSMHNQQAELPYEYSTGADISGLMIHMPQPRAPQAAVLSSNINDSLIMPSPSSSYYHHPHSGGRRNSSSSSQYHHGHHSDHRRPRPRAPSSGARHYGSSSHYGGPMTSPRKVSSSAACYTLREESISPTPLPRQRTSSSSSSSSLALRKQRSWSRQHRKGGEPRTPSSGRVRSSSCRSAGYDHGGGGGGGGSLSIEFCNYTPSDKKVLMNGVAPSGSSKTKARREREAQEKNEKYVEAIRAAGVDVEKLRQNGFLFTK
ncbi:Regulatory protein wetA [Daldinia childiae]|uniref:Regulatory protein wetA n=1 Tax=Daldinia childiae TaxID=326645 RepID=UPI0014458ED3|nr:Regulatory protein wetA [Daldinia childiae]KAF3058385.1 Regulatory protein wetA [Daldinia childiae]